jgi:tRNA threonylcarbamoyladenosine biosynthesis protein TsaB
MSDILILHIETATRNCSVALSKNGTCISSKSLVSDGFIHGEQLTLFIEEVFRYVDLKYADLSAISVSAGPGSYTGLRIGLSSAKGLCFALGVPLIGLSTLEIMVEQAKNQTESTHFIPMIDARRMEVFTGVYTNISKTALAPHPLVLETDSLADFEPFVFFGDGAEKVRALWANRNVQFIDLNYPDANFQSKLAFEKFKNQQFEDLAYFTPEYVKAFHSTAANPSNK